MMITIQMTMRIGEEEVVEEAIAIMTAVDLRDPHDPHDHRPDHRPDHHLLVEEDEITTITMITETITIEEVE